MNSDIPESSSAKRLIAYSFLVAFANDRTIDEGEFRLLEKMALEDGVLDEAEKEVLAMLFSRISASTVTPKVWEDITRFREEHGF